MTARDVEDILVNWGIPIAIGAVLIAAVAYMDDWPVYCDTCRHPLHAKECPKFKVQASRYCECGRLEKKP